MKVRIDVKTVSEVLKEPGRTEFLTLVKNEIEEITGDGRLSGVHDR